MIRKIIEIDQEKCNGCGACVTACHEQAIQLIDGKAKLIRDDYCDGLGDCLPACPTNAISFIEREALPYDEEAVKRNKEAKSCGCLSQQEKEFERNESCCSLNLSSNLRQWPVQIKLVPTNAAYFDHAHLLIAADCTAYAYANFHHDFMKNKITLIGCPKLDNVNYAEKLTEIIKNNNIRSITLVKMEVFCCSKMETFVKAALLNSGKFIEYKIVTISCDGKIID